MAIRGYVFDVYGTLLDPISVAEACRALLPDPTDLVVLWRAKQLEYTWLRSLMGAYVDFWEVTGEALDYAAARHGIRLDDAGRDSILQAYFRLAPYPDALPGIERLRGRPLAALSNGSPDMLERALSHSGLRSHFEWVISADEVRVYKPSPRVYVLGPERIGVNAEELLFVSSNAFDALGAKGFGYQVAWINRFGQLLDPIGRPPDYEIKSLLELPMEGSVEGAAGR